MLCSLYLAVPLLLLIYKIADYLVRIPSRSHPSRDIDNVMITGCDSGFGRLFALRLVRKGFTVFAACLTEKGRTELKEKASGSGSGSGSGRIISFIMDVCDTSSVQKAFEFVKENIAPGDGMLITIHK